MPAAPGAVPSIGPPPPSPPSSPSSSDSPRSIAAARARDALGLDALLVLGHLLEVLLAEPRRGRPTRSLLLQPEALADELEPGRRSSSASRPLRAPLLRADEPAHARQRRRPRTRPSAAGAPRRALGGRVGEGPSSSRFSSGAAGACLGLEPGRLGAPAHGARVDAATCASSLPPRAPRRARPRARRAGRRGPRRPRASRRA